MVVPPGFSGYKPYGISSKQQSAIELLYEEYETIKLSDFYLLNQAEAGAIMGVSRATYARMYEAARRKIARALVEARQLTTIIGHVELDTGWHRCKNCHIRFTVPDNANQKCPLCANSLIEQIHQ